MMNKYILDTNVLIDMKRGINGIRENIQNAGPENCFISAISIAELKTGYEISRDPEELQNIVFCTSKFTIIPVSENILDEFARMKAVQIRTEKKVPDFDLAIAATANTFGFTVVTHDEKHFSLIENIKRTDWNREK